MWTSPTPPSWRCRMGRYLNAVIDLLQRVAEANEEAVRAGAGILADVIARQGLVHVFGSGHSQLLALEIQARAGGLVPVQVIYDPTFGKAETVEGYAVSLLRDYELSRGEAMIVISNSGRNPAPIEIAMAARERGLSVIALTAVEFSRSVSSRHSSGKRLFELADVVLDTMGGPGDALVRVEGLDVPVGPSSTVVGGALINELMVVTTEELVRRGFEPPVLRSQNLDGSEVHNQRVMAAYWGRIRRVI